MMPAEKLITEVEDRAMAMDFGTRRLVQELARRYEKAISIDTIPVIHCADCQHCALDYAEQGFGYPTKPIRVCIIHDHETTLDDYCSWARRKDGVE